MDGIMERYQGSESEVFIDTIGENKVTQIGTKAFLSCKSVKKLVLSDRIDRIGDWAFAHMQNLQLLELPCHEINLGRKVFLGCEALRQIRIRGDESGNQGTPFFMVSRRGYGRAASPLSGKEKKGQNRAGISKASLSCLFRGRKEESALRIFKGAYAKG